MELCSVILLMVQFTKDKLLEFTQRQKGKGKIISFNLLRFIMVGKRLYRNMEKKMDMHLKVVELAYTFFI